MFNQLQFQISYSRRGQADFNFSIPSIFYDSLDAIAIKGFARYSSILLCFNLTDATKIISSQFSTWNTPHNDLRMQELDCLWIYYYSELDSRSQEVMQQYIAKPESRSCSRFKYMLSTSSQARISVKRHTWFHLSAYTTHSSRSSICAFVVLKERTNTIQSFSAMLQLGTRKYCFHYMPCPYLAKNSYKFFTQFRFNLIYQFGCKILHGFPSKIFGDAHDTLRSHLLTYIWASVTPAGKKWKEYNSNTRHIYQNYLLSSCYYIVNNAF